MPFWACLLSFCALPYGPWRPAVQREVRDNPKSAVIVQSVFLLNIERIVVFAFRGYGRLCHGKTDENASIETKRRLEGMNEQNG